jgi:hypothetical protein
MEKSKQNIPQMLREIVKDRNEIYSVVGKVISLNENERSCDVEPLNGDADLFGVRLQADLSASTGAVVIPKIDSHVIVTFLNNSTGFVSVCTDVDKIHVECDSITFNGGSNDGMVLINELVGKINRLEDAHNAHVNAFNSHIHVTSATTGTGGPIGVITPPNQPSTELITPNTTVSDLENTKIKQ